MHHDDIDLLPLPAPARGELTASLTNIERGRRQTCARLDKATGPWRVGLLQLGMTIASDTKLALVSSDVQMNGGVPTLGAMRFTMLTDDGS